MRLAPSCVFAHIGLAYCILPDFLLLHSWGARSGRSPLRPIERVPTRQFRTVFNSYEPSILSCAGRGSSSRVKNVPRKRYREISEENTFSRFSAKFHRERECATHGGFNWQLLTASLKRATSKTRGAIHKSTCFPLCNAVIASIMHVNLYFALKYWKNASRA